MRPFVMDPWATVYSRLVVYMWMDKTVKQFSKTCFIHIYHFYSQCISV
jgi:hypothetical protein